MTNRAISCSPVTNRRSFDSQFSASSIATSEGDDIDSMLVNDLFRDPDLRDRIYSVSGRGKFFACLSKGPLEQYHTLVCPFRQSCSTGIASRGGNLQELKTFVRDIGKMLSGLCDTDILMFEHGSSSLDPFGCGTSSAHVHLLASNVTPSDLEGVDTYFAWEKGLSWQDLQQISTQGYSYMMMAELNFSMSVHTFANGESSPSQYLRMLYHKYTKNSASYKWQDNPNGLDFEQQVSQLRGITGWEKISESRSFHMNNVNSFAKSR